MRWEGKASIRNISKEAMKVIHARDESDLDQDGCSAACEKWSDSAYVMKIELSTFRDG